MNRRTGLGFIAALLVAAGAAAAQDRFPAIVVSAVELSGDGAIAGTNFDNGVRLGFEAINEAGGILGRQVEVITLDIETKPEVTKVALLKAGELKAVAVMGPVVSGMVQAGLEEIKASGVPTFIGGKAAGLTEQGAPNRFRTSLSQAAAMPKLARSVREPMQAKSVAMVWVDNEFGRNGRQAMAKALAAEGVELVADLRTAPQQTDFATVVEAIGAAGPDVAFIDLNERESADLLRQLHGGAFGGWVVGETTLMGQSVLELAGEAANGIRGHVGLTADALVPGIRDFANAFRRRYGYKSDQNGMKGYIAAHVFEAAAEKAGSLEPAAVTKAMHGLVLTAPDHPGVLLDVRYDEKGDLDRASFIVRVSNSRHEFIATLPPAAGSRQLLNRPDGSGHA